MGDLFALVTFGPEGWGDELAAGTWLTVRLALTTVPFGLALGFLVALGRRSGHRIAAPLAAAFTTVFRGLPELLTLFLVYYGGQALLHAVLAPVLDAPLQVSAFAAGVVALGLVFAAFASEVFLGAFNAVPKGQVEAARALGLSPVQVTRVAVAPAVLRHALPGLANLWLVLVKDTALVSVIALADLMRETQLAVGATDEPFLFYGVACLIYLVLSGLSGLGIVAAERWSRRHEREAWGR